MANPVPPTRAVSEEAIVDKLYEETKVPPLVAMLTRLEDNLPMFSEGEQAFISSCRLTLALNEPLPVTHIQGVQLLIQRLREAKHNTVNAEGAISVGKILKDLASAEHMLSPAEKAYAIGIAKKLKAKQPFTSEEIQKILIIHGNKGF